MAEENYVKLELGKQVTMRFKEFAWDMRKIIDPRLGFEKTVKTLAFHVIEKNGEPADTVFSLISETAQKEFEPYLTNERYRRYKFTMIKEGNETRPPRIMSATPI